MILEKKAQEKDFLSGSGNVEPAGVYAKVHLNNIDLTDNSSGRISNRGEGQKNSRDSKGALARVSIRENSDFTGSAISIAAGDRITIFIRVMRNPSPGCSRKSFDFDRTFVAQETTLLYMIGFTERILMTSLGMMELRVEHLP